MPVCSSGASQQKSGIGQDIALTTSAIAALLNNVPTLWAVPLAALVGTASYHLSTFCTVDPPSMPTFSTGDLAALVSLNDFDAFLAAQRKFRDLVDIYAWYQMCECASVTTPAPPSPPADPGGLVINPPVVSPPFPNGPCATYHFQGTTNDSNLPAHPPYFALNGATYVELTGTFSSPTTATNSWGGGIYWINASGTQIGAGAGIYVTTTVNQLSYTASPPSGAVAYGFFWGNNGFPPSPALNWTLDVNVYCGSAPGSPNGVVPQPCQTDPSIQLVLSQILQYVTLIQRQAVPFAYVTGTVHAGLTGTGAFNVQGILGLLANITVPTSTGEIAGTPSVRIPIGRLNMATADGYEDRCELVTDSQLVTPPLMSLFTVVGYSLEPGVTMTLTELVREP